MHRDVTLVAKKSSIKQTKISQVKGKKRKTAKEVVMLF